MTDKILVGIDGSHGSSRAAEFAATQAKLNNAELIVAYVIEWSPYSFNTPEENETRHKRRKQEIEIAEEKILKPLLDKLHNKGMVASGLVHHGKPAEVLSQLAEKNDAKQIVVGRIGESGLKSLFFGSVTSHLVQTSSIPVTIVP